MSKRKIKDGFVWRRGKKIAVTMVTDDNPPKQYDKAYARVLLKDAAKIAKATKSQQLFIWIWLLHQTWQTNSKTFLVSNGPLVSYGIDRTVKYRALLALEAAGFIALERNGKQAFIVTILKGTIQK